MNHQISRANLARRLALQERGYLFVGTSLVDDGPAGQPWNTGVTAPDGRTHDGWGADQDSSLGAACDWADSALEHDAPS